ncbi:MAG: phosphate ABC transporter permease subunit PstC, partial [Rhodospirillales bacterium]|nr:phosphate ABC transporter permease subunit PstC [Rhodospirillales bacterium]
MSVWFIVVVLLMLSTLGFYLGKQRALSAKRGESQSLHSLPGYYGYYVALWCIIPTLLLILLWLALEPRILETLLIQALPAEDRDLSAARLNLMLGDIRNARKAAS